MDYIDWCELILSNVMTIASTNVMARTVGVSVDEDLLPEMFGDDRARSAEFWASKERLSVHEAIDQLSQAGLVNVVGQMRVRPSELAEALQGDMTEYWQSLCEHRFKDDQEQILRVTNRLSVRSNDACAWTEWVEHSELLTALSWGEDKSALLHAVAVELNSRGAIKCKPTIGPGLSVRASYRGLIWENRRSLSRESKFIEQLVSEWETANVEFKRNCIQRPLTRRLNWSKT